MVAGEGPEMVGRVHIHHVHLEPLVLLEGLAAVRTGDEFSAAVLHLQVLVQPLVEVAAEVAGARAPDGLPVAHLLAGVLGVVPGHVLVQPVQTL